MKRLLILIAAAALLLLCGCGKGHNVGQFVDDCVAKIRSGPTLESVCEDVFPKEYIKRMKDSGKWAEVTGKYSMYFGSGIKLDVKDLKKSRTLSGSQRKAAEDWFFSSYDCAVEIEEGYEYTFTAVVTIADKPQYFSLTACAVYLKGEGWKILPEKASEL